jgi:NAD(P)H-hydrate epimerase
MKIVTASEMREIDRMTTERHNVPSLTLMENAGRAVCDFVRERYPRATRIAIICGKGNNGGDGFVAARHLHHAGKVVEVVLLAEPTDLQGDAAHMFQRLQTAALPSLRHRHRRNECSEEAHPRHRRALRG